MTNRSIYKLFMLLLMLQLAPVRADVQRPLEEKAEQQAPQGARTVEGMPVGDVAEEQGNDLFVKSRISKKSFYERETITMEYFLYSVSPDVVFCESPEPLSLDRGEIKTLRQIEVRGTVGRERIGDRVYYVFPVESYALAAEGKGEIMINPRKFVVGVNVTEVVNDPMWGRRRVARTLEFESTTSKETFQLKSLPIPPKDFSFSGAIGEYRIETMIPEGLIIINEEATALIRLVGNGMLSNDLLPEYQEAFGHNNRLKSMKSNVEILSTPKGIVSELEVECDFIPTSINDCEIGNVRFGYFNPKTEMYETAESGPLKVKVKSSTIKREIKDA